MAVVGRDPIAAFYSPLTRFWELMVGGGLAWLVQSGRLNGRGGLARECASAAGLVAILTSVVVLSRHTPFPGWWALMPTAGAIWPRCRRPSRRRMWHRCVRYGVPAFASASCWTVRRFATRPPNVSRVAATRVSPIAQ